jgi:hypothetical protein
LLACLGRTPEAIDRISVETLVASVVRARRLRAQGKNDVEERRLVLQAVRATGIRPQVASAPAPLTIQQQLALRGYQPPAGDPVAIDDEEDDLADDTGGMA